jgi:hypothetical protein
MRTFPRIAKLLLCGSLATLECSAFFCLTETDLVSLTYTPIVYLLSPPDQDKGLDILQQSIARQKNMGMAIGNELEDQNGPLPFSFFFSFSSSCLSAPAHFLSAHL